MDGAGNVYTTEANAITAVERHDPNAQHSGPSSSSGLAFPGRCGSDGVGNVYVADTDNNTIVEWNAATQTVSTPISSGLDYPEGVAVDSSGNVYIADSATTRSRNGTPQRRRLPPWSPRGCMTRMAWRWICGQRLHRRYHEQRHRGVERHDPDSHHSDLLGVEWPEGRGGGWRGQRLHR